MAKAILSFTLLISMMGFWAGADAARADQFSEVGIDRPGGDILRTEMAPLTGGGFGSLGDNCRLSCTRNGNCKAWTLVKAGVQGPKAVCYLKNVIPNKVANGCCTSGVPLKAFEVNVDRPGSDYNVVDIGNDANLCKAACQADAKCVSWTWVKPGVQTPSARCYFKSREADAFTNTCCTSGIADRPGPQPN